MNDADWSFQPVRQPAAPAVKQEEWVRNSIDRFVLARLEAAGISPSPEADRSTLIRRLSLDLTDSPRRRRGRCVLRRPAPDYYERLIERLLASPHFGERWGRHWLDQARYADTDGFEVDSRVPSAWRLATGSSPPSTQTCRSINLRSSRSPVTCFPIPRRCKGWRPPSIGSR